MAPNINFITKTAEQIVVLWGNGCRGRGQPVFTSGDVWGKKESRKKREIVCGITCGLQKKNRTESFPPPTHFLFAAQAKGATIRRKEQKERFCSVKRV